MIDRRRPTLNVVPSLTVAACLALCGQGHILEAANPACAWDFTGFKAPLVASVGANLQLVGTHAVIPGAHPADGAVRIGVGSCYRCTHGIAANGAGTLVNRYSLLIDFRIPALDPRYCFFQTNPTNTTDGDCFIRPGDGAIGVAQTGCSNDPSPADVW